MAEQKIPEAKIKEVCLLGVRGWVKSSLTSQDQLGYPQLEVPAGHTAGSSCAPEKQMLMGVKASRGPGELSTAPAGALSVHLVSDSPTVIKISNTLLTANCSSQTTPTERTGQT